MKNIELTQEQYLLLQSLGITPRYTGFFQLCYAVNLVIVEPERLLLITKWLYPDVAKQHQTSWKAVERNIRTITAIAWETNPTLIEEIACHPLSQRPRNSEFLAMLAMYFTLPRHRLNQAVTLSRKDYNMRVVNQTINQRCS